MCSNRPDGTDLKASMPLFMVVGLGQISNILTDETDPFLLIWRSLKTSKASWMRDSEESSITGISTLNLGCFCFLVLPMGLGLLRGFCKVVKRLVLAWRTASSFEDGGVGEGEDREE